VYRVLEHALTVRLCTDVKDVEVMVDLLAHGLMQDSGMPSQPRRAWPPHRYRSTFLILGTAFVAALLTGYWLWTPLSNILVEQLSVKSQLGMVRWQPPQVFYRQPGGIPFTLPLPDLERTPVGARVDFTLEPLGGELSWLQLDPEQLHLRGTPPVTTDDRTYRLIVRARTGQGSDSQLLVGLTITGQPDRMIQTPQLHGHWAW
jgi:hypothetical protein